MEMSVVLSSRRAIFVGCRTLSGTGSGPPAASENTPEWVVCDADGRSVGVAVAEVEAPLECAVVLVGVVSGNIPACWSVLSEDEAAAGEELEDACLCVCVCTVKTRKTPIAASRSSVTESIQCMCECVGACDIFFGEEVLCIVCKPFLQISFQGFRLFLAEPPAVASNRDVRRCRWRT